jgi:8-oxo-dGTP pyrophosphatase MutT (NUDIX family)
MPSSNARIRPIAICVFRHNDKILVCRATDTVKNETYYRPLGGGIEFQEFALDALKREISEELNQEIKDEKFLGVLENRFILDGVPKHEIIMVFDGSFVDESVYLQETVEIKELGWETAEWRSISEFGPEKLILYPEGIMDLLSKT